jgi:hypothetical protein
MGVSGGPDMIQNGLVLLMDASDTFSPVSRNLYNYTSDLTNANWVKTRCQITGSFGTAPDGTNTAAAMTITDSSSLVRLTHSSFTASVEGGPYTFSVYVKNNNCTAGVLNLGIYNGTQTAGTEPEYAIQANFTPTGSTPALVVTRSIQDVGNGWYRITNTTILTSSVHTFSNFIDIENGLGGNKVNGESILLWGPQFEAGLSATSYQAIATTTRTAPDLSNNNNTGTYSTNRPTWTPNNQGSIAFLSPPLGNPTISYPSSSTINISGSNMSAEVWVKFNYLDYTTTSGSLMYFFYKGIPDNPNPHNGFWFSYDNRGNRGSFTYTCFGNTSGGFSGGGNNFGDSIYSQNFTTGSWNYIAFTINNNTGSFYINGVQKGTTKNFTNLDLYNTGSSTMGVSTGGVRNTPFEIASLKLYNRSLSPTEISQNYNALKSRFNL